VLGQLERIPPVAAGSFRLLRWSDNLREVESVLDANHAKPISGVGDRWHYHVEMELTVFTKGEGAFFVGDHIGPLAAGEVVLLGENLPHHWNVRGPCAGLSAQWNFPPEHAFWGLSETLSLAGTFEKAAHGIRYGGRTAAAVISGMQEMARSGGLDRFGLWLRLLSLLERAPGSEQTLLSRRPFSLPTDSARQQAMSEAMRYLLAHFRSTIRLDEVLRLTGMSKATFARQFKRHSGRTFSEFVARLRLQSACRELVETDRSILEIALSCGFNEVSFFNRLFRRVLSCCPTEYRARGGQQVKATTRTPSRTKDTGFPVAPPLRAGQRSLMYGSSSQFNDGQRKPSTLPS
jgi:AraC-like DNA-binding protein